MKHFLRWTGVVKSHQETYVPRSVLARNHIGLAGLMVLVLVTGCSKSDHPVVFPVKGVVTYKGQPVSGAMVTFFPKTGRPAGGTTGADGKFELSTFAPGDGAMPGPHQVAIAKRTPISDKPYSPVKDELPAQYGDVSKSPLTADVTEKGPNEFPFALGD